MTGHVHVDFVLRDETSPRMRALAERIHRMYGLSRSSSTREENMMPKLNGSNPYDRRDPHEHRLAGDGSLLAEPMRLTGPSTVLTIEDLDAMAASVSARARRVERDHADDEHAAALQDARRRAWDEGHRSGMQHGRSALLSDIDREHGANVRDQVDRIAKVTDDERATKVDLVVVLKATEALLRALVVDHHDGFTSARTAR